MTDRTDARPGATSEDLARSFEQHRRRLVGVAYRMLGTLADAEDAVQDAWLRLAGTRADEVEDLGAWLTTVTSRLCLDRLRSARHRREAYVGPWLPEPLVHLAEPAAGPAELAELDESLRLAFLVVLEQLSPEQRVAFVLHDVFAVPFDQVADVLATTPAAARQLASRARRAVSDTAPEPAAPLPLQRDVVDRLCRAVLDGDMAAVVGTLAPGVVLRSDGGGRVRAALRPVVGAEKVARFLLGIAQAAAVAPVSYAPVLVNGEVGLLVEVGAAPGLRTDAGATVMVPRVGRDGLVRGLDVVRNPDKLTRLPRT